MSNKQPKDYLALALDNCSTIEQVEILIDQTKASVGVYKIGLELFTRFGPEIVKRVQKKAGGSIFLDLKYHDIPNTVAQAVTAAAELGVQFCTIHTHGGLEMMKAAALAAHSARQNGKKAPKIIGVTVLTSISQDMLNNELNVGQPLIDQVKNMAQLAVAAGLDGIVCSAADLHYVKSVVPGSFEIITPGIRPAGADKMDQKRVATPAAAVKQGATLLVVGRPITGAKDPGKAAQEIVEGLFD